MKYFLTLFSLLLLLGGCNNSNTTNTESIAEENTKIYTVIEDIDIRTEPSSSSAKLINEKASSITGETEYCSVDKSVKMNIVEVKGDWSKIKVTEPEWLADTYNGMDTYKQTC